tara:strand:+ start:1099 stop:1734 length:636 start_codon:yes stop_codon:yes gene_type:complete
MESILNNHSHIMELIGAFLTGVVGPILYLIVQKYLLKEKNKKRDIVKENISSVSLINNELEDIREEFKADRVWITQFHNGGNFFPTGKSMHKFSVFYEVAKSGVSTVSTIFNNIPCSLYPKAFEHMMGGKGIFINDYKDAKVATYGLKGAAESVGTKSTYLIPLFTLDEKYIGNIGVDFVSKKKRLTKDEWEHLQIKAGRISGFISNHLVA